MPRYTTNLSQGIPLIGIDLGYSARNRSCGLAYSTDLPSCSLTFGEAIEAVAQCLNASGPHILILEAVLSTYHSPGGNPAVRGDFEKGRGWYHGPGVTTFAAALRFLTVLDAKLREGMQIPLVEGFLSYKTDPTTHCADAERLVAEFETAERFTAAQGSEAILPSINGVPPIRRYNAPP